MIKDIIINQCYSGCNFHTNSMDGMYCGHPYFDSQETYSNMIITHENSRERVPDECPLRKESLTINYKLR